MTTFRNGFKFGIGFSVACVLVTALAMSVPAIMVMYEEQTTNETWSPDVVISKINHWHSGDKIVFVGELESKSDKQWKSLEVIFELVDNDGKNLGKCKDTAYNPRFSETAVPFEAKCYHMPLELNGYTYETVLYGRY